MRIVVVRSEGRGEVVSESGRRSTRNGTFEDAQRILKAYGNPPCVVASAEPLVRKSKQILQVMDEHVAVALAEGLDEPGTNGRFCVLDLGGTRAKSSVISSADGVLRIENSEICSEISAASFSLRLRNFVAGKVSERSERKLMEACERAAKILASGSPQAMVEAEEIDGRDVSVRISAAKFKDLCSDLYSKLDTLKLCERVVLAGQIRGSKTEEKVAFGAAKQATLLVSSSSPKKKLLLLPKSLPHTPGDVWCSSSAAATTGEEEGEKIVLVPAFSPLPFHSTTTVPGPFLLFGAADARLAACEGGGAVSTWIRDDGHITFRVADTLTIRCPPE
ncbi:hypothetical protein CTAYLR_002133 [Chrysophaeum taylorii]|uniref:Uncharacterized protein n=1 Tax=Chrysophaeum taylorii TaxID=2483200 RepID=A0AAD7UMF1_9STRA|nr:hypothetical protein CTAYLR_002133 [Chrysophaeum taylorii]